MATREELITLFGDDFGEVLVGLDQLPKEVLELLDSTMNNMLFDADVFTNRIAKTVGTQTSAGVATSSIEDILANDMGEEGRIFGELRNTVKESLVEGINQTSRAGAFQAYDPDEDTLFTWVTVAGHRICKDCLPRGGERKTLRDWEAAGVPASGWSICGGYCYCILDPSGKMSPRVQLEEREGGLRIQEKGATARPKVVTKKTTPLIDILKNKFKSKNKSANEHFINSFKNSKEKLVSVINTFPVLKSVQYGRKRGYFSTQTQKGFDLKTPEDVKYFRTHGGINVGSLKDLDATNKVAYNRGISVIRHEYGHFMHHNLHPYIGMMDDIYKEYHKAIKTGVVKTVDEFAELNQLYRHTTDHLKFHVAYINSRHKIGVGSKWKRGNTAISDKYTDMLEEMNLRVRYKENTKAILKRHEVMELYGDTKKRNVHFVDNDALIEALKKDKFRTHETIQDLFEAVTNGKMGYGHGASYYKWKGMSLHETFAELTRLYAHENDIYWKWIKKEMPELTTYYENLLDDILENGYFGKLQEGFQNV